MEKKINLPQKGAGRKWAARFKELGKQPPPQDLVDKINNGNKKLKLPQKSAGARLRELSIKRRANMKPSKELFEILQHPEESIEVPKV